MLIVALTGGIASGKTAVSDTFNTLGVPVIDADLLSREAVAPESPGLNQIKARFGDSIITEDGTLDRKKLRQIVFNDEQSRKDLETIVHPEVRRLTRKAIEQHKQALAPYCIVVIPLLVETGQQNNYDHIVVVDVSEETQITRVAARDGSSEAQAKKILSSQATRKERLDVADDVITNSGTLQELHTAIQSLHQKLLNIAAKPISH